MTASREVLREIARPARGTRSKRSKYPMPVNDDSRPVIRLDVDLDRVVAEACSAISADPDTFQRDRQLVHVIAGDGRRAGAPLIRPMTTATIRVRLTAAARFAKFDKRSEGWVPALPSDAVVRGLEDLGSYPGVRPLVGVAETPFPRSDGTIVQTPGYDADTAYVYIPSAEFPPVPERPTREDARRAIGEILEVVVDFPFASPAHRSAWLALLLTLFARPAIDGPVPAFGIKATTRGTGKTKLADAASLIFTGRESHKRPFAEDDKELRKVLTGALADGDRMTVFDNVARPIEGASLDNAITSRSWRDRELGTNGTISAENVTTIVFTGNGLTFGGDTVRRVLPIDLEAGEENPEHRTGFRHGDLFAWIATERPRLVVAALTTLRAWYCAGRPSMDVQPLGSFEAWSRIVPAVLRWVGEECPMQTRAGIDASDDGRNALAGLLEGWERLQAGGSLTAAQVIRALYPPPTREERAPDPEWFGDMRAAVETLAAQTKPSAIKLAGVLRTNKRRICEGRRIDTAVGRAGVVRWRVERVDQGGNDDGSP